MLAPNCHARRRRLAHRRRGMFGIAGQGFSMSGVRCRPSPPPAPASLVLQARPPLPSVCRQARYSSAPSQRRSPWRRRCGATACPAPWTIDERRLFIEFDQCEADSGSGAALCQCGVQGFGVVANPFDIKHGRSGHAIAAEYSDACYRPGTRSAEPPLRHSGPAIGSSAASSRAASSRARCRSMSRAV